MTMDAIDITALLRDQQWLRRLARRLTADDAAADDAVQEVYVAALRHPPASRQSGARGWLATVLRNRIRDQARFERRRARPDPRSPPQDEIADETPSPEVLAERLELHRLVAGLVLELPPDLREAILLCCVEGLTSAQAAARLGVAAGTVRWRLKQAIECLRKGLDRRYGEQRNRWIVLLAPLAAPPPLAERPPREEPARRPRGRGLTGAGAIAGGAALMGLVWLAGTGGEEAIVPPPAAHLVAGAPSALPATASALAAPRSPAWSTPMWVLPAREVVPDEVWRVLAAGNGPTRGPLGAPVTIVGFLDFTNPLSVAANLTVSEVMAAHPGEVRYVVRLRPLLPGGQLAAEALLAAHEQDRFWPFLERVLADPSGTDRTALEQHARGAGLDLSRFSQALTDRRLKTAVDAEAVLARSAGLMGVPNFLVNRQIVQGALPRAVFEDAIQEELARAAGLPVREPRPSKRERLRYPHSLEWPPPRIALPGDALGRPVALPQFVGKAPSRGNPRASIEVHCFPRYGSPWTKQTRVVLEGLVHTHGEVVRLSARPLAGSPSEEEQPDAEALWAADAQGRFWQLHDAMLAQGPPFSRAVLDRLAGEIGLDRAAFNRALDQHRFRARVEADLAFVRATRATSVPSCVVDGTLADGPSALLLLVEQALERAGVSLPRVPSSPIVTDPRSPDYDVRDLMGHVRLNQLYRSEARDPSWASAVETALRAAMVADVRRLFPKATVVTFECRASLCRLGWAGLEASLFDDGVDALKSLYRVPGSFDGNGMILALRSPEMRSVPEMLAHLAKRRGAP